MRPDEPPTRRPPSIPSAIAPPPSLFSEQDDHEAPPAPPAVFPLLTASPESPATATNRLRHDTVAIAPPTFPLNSQGEPKRVAHISCEDPASRWPSITPRTPCRRPQRRYRLSMGENVAMLHFVHVLDLSAAADDAGKHKHVCGDIVMTQAVSIRLKASWGRSAGAPGRGRQDK